MFVISSHEPKLQLRLFWSIIPFVNVELKLNVNSSLFYGKIFARTTKLQIFEINLQASSDSVDSYQAYDHKVDVFYNLSFYCIFISKSVTVPAFHFGFIFIHFLDVLFHTLMLRNIKIGQLVHLSS